MSIFDFQSKGRSKTPDSLARSKGWGGTNTQNRCPYLFLETIARVWLLSEKLLSLSLFPRGPFVQGDQDQSQLLRPTQVISDQMTLICTVTLWRI
ncbi:hypothetical protein XELAEV_18022756mg [Xenopus laevis]|uniref:Uncharacterized protein n=1 Tax=Xenopus laevis TaxID=8355 RepID=A0A974HP01_XENLA|nr:hypothetical protein XELAEV_18022756mg [Xenopus laevis]